MNKTTAPLVLVLGGLFLSGCAAAKLIKQGDASMLASRPQEAVGLYQKALAKDPDLARKPAFVEKLRLAESGAAYAEGKALAEQGQWDQAVERYQQALMLIPDDSQTQVDLGQGTDDCLRMKGALTLAATPTTDSITAMVSW